MSRLADIVAYIESAMPTWECPVAALVIVRGDENGQGALPQS